jgi:transcriptional regulator with XRE-family HTH domain
MQTRLNAVMARHLDSLAQRVKHARNMRGMTQVQLARGASMKQPDISKIELGSIAQTTGIARLSKALRVPVEWLEFGAGPEPDWAEDCADATKSVSDVSGHALVAHGVSLERAETVPSLQWEQLMSEDRNGALPHVFRVGMPDGSMAPRVKAGDMVVMDTTITARPGDGVLVRDRTGQLHVRQYRAGRPGVWEAHALDAAYAPMESERDGLVVLAVLTAVEARWG